jgi:hypothetical protein
MTLQEYLWHVDHVGPNHKSKEHKSRPVGRPHFECRDLAATFIRRLTRESHAWELVEIGRSGRPAIHHLQTDSIKSVEASLDLYIRILTVELTHTTLFL